MKCWNFKTKSIYNKRLIFFVSMRKEHYWLFCMCINLLHRISQYYTFAVQMLSEFFSTCSIISNAK